MLEIIGLALGLAAALDFAIRADAKKKVAAYFQKYSVTVEPIEHKGYQYIQSLFGPFFFSIRAITLSVVISIISLILSYLYAVATSDFEIVWIFEEKPSLLAGTFFAIFLVGSIIGDIISYAQTRLFLKTIDQYRTGIVTIGLALADAVISLFIFIVIFSFTRLLSYLTIVAGFSGSQLTSTQAINLDLLEDRLPALIQQGLVSAEEVEWMTFLAKAREEDESLIDNSLRIYSESVVGPVRDDEEFALEARVECAPLGAESFLLIDTTQMIAKSTAGLRGYGELDREYRNIYDDVKVALSGWSPDITETSDLNCVTRTLVISRTMSAGRLLDIAGPNNAWWASFQMTSFDAYSSLAYKFGPYVHIDPFHDIDRFYDSIIFQSGYSFFDLTYADPTIPYLLSEFSYDVPEDTETLKVPFSPMLGSALAVSALFWLYIVLIYVSRGFSTFTKIVLSVSTRFDPKRAPFTSLVSILGIFVIGAWMAFWFLGFFWRVVF